MKKTYIIPNILMVKVGVSPILSGSYALTTTVEEEENVDADIVLSKQFDIWGEDE